MLQILAVAQIRDASPAGFAPVCQIGSRSCTQGGVTTSCSTAKKKELAHPTSTGFWEIDPKYVYYLDVRLTDELVNFFKAEKSDVMELGAGMGCYTYHLQSRGVSIRAYDGSPSIANRTNGLVHTADLSQKMSLGKPADWVACIEVAEHVPPQYEGALISNLQEHNRKGILLSWSSLKPPHGNGHVNPRSEQWVIARFAELGYTVDVKASRQLRQAAQLPWFKSDLFVMRRSSPQSR